MSRESRFRFTMVKQGPKAPQLGGYSLTIDPLGYDYQKNVSTPNRASQATGAHQCFGPFGRARRSAKTLKRTDLGWLLASSAAGGKEEPQQSYKN